MFHAGDNPNVFWLIFSGSKTTSAFCSGDAAGSSEIQVPCAPRFIRDRVHHSMLIDLVLHGWLSGTLCSGHVPQ